MSTKTIQTEKGKKPSSSQRRRAVRRRRGLGVGAMTAIVIGVAIAALAGIYFLNATTSNTSQAGQYPFQVGQPGPGMQAPALHLSSTDGSIFDLAALRGKTVLLYFQEGVGCEPCWNQLKDIQSQRSDFQTLGIDQIVSITGDPLTALKQKVADEGISIPILSDPSLVVSQTYTANSYGMMGASSDGHTMIVVGPDGRIRWRADYGGAPKYIMYVPVPNLLADIRVGLKGK